MGASDTRAAPTAVVLIIGTELVEGLRVDTNGPELSRTLSAAGYLVRSREVLPDDPSAISSRIEAHLGSVDLIVVTGGLGPTHDDVTREATAAALGLELATDPALHARLGPVIARHRSPGAAAQAMRQALVIDGAQVISPSTGTAPGQLITSADTRVLLLPGPPAELRPMLAEVLSSHDTGRAERPRSIRCVHVMESDVQVAAERVIQEYPGITLTVLATPALVDVLLLPRGADGPALDEATSRVAEALGRSCYSTDGSTLPETLVRTATSSGISVAVAESCTGGLLSAGITEVPGASAVFAGGFVTYSDALKASILGVSPRTIAEHGSVSEPVAREMAQGARDRSGADLAVAITGIAGPGGGSPDKPVGTVWFALADSSGISAWTTCFRGDRAGVRTRAVVAALDALRHAAVGLGPVEE